MQRCTIPQWKETNCQRRTELEQKAGTRWFTMLETTSSATQDVGLREGRETPSILCRLHSSQGLYRKSALHWSTFYLNFLKARQLDTDLRFGVWLHLPRYFHHNSSFQTFLPHFRIRNKSYIVMWQIHKEIPSRKLFKKKFHKVTFSLIYILD
jgi:hypothetical protein